MKILGIDFETTGLSPDSDRIIEVGAVLWDWDTGTPLILLSALVYPERPIPEEIAEITGITDELVESYGRPETDVLAGVEDLISRADYVMAHNGTAFDKLFHDAALARLGWSPDESMWLDSRTDVRYPERITTRNLRYLASEHQFLNPFAHRAVFDVLTMFKIASNYSIEDIIARAKEPTFYVQAVVSFDEKEKAKARGYYWCGPKKIWWRTFKESDYIAELDVCDFRTVLMEGSPE